MSVQGLALKSALEVVADNGDLIPTSPEGLRGREIADITQTEDVRVRTVLQSLVVDIKKAILVHEVRLCQELLLARRHHRVQVVVVTLSAFTGLQVHESSLVCVHVHLC